MSASLTALSAVRVSALSRWSKVCTGPSCGLRSTGVPPASTTAAQGSVSSTRSVPSAATRNAMVFPLRSAMAPPSSSVPGLANRRGGGPTTHAGDGQRPSRAAPSARGTYAGCVTSSSRNLASYTGSLVLLRHGETEWSKSGQHTGLTDIPLTERGEDLARDTASLLKGRTFTAVLTSPLVRARRTAELAGLEGAEVEPRLVEWDYGGYEGLTTPQIRERVGYPWTVFHDGVVPGDTPGETVHDVAARVRGVIDRILPL